MNGLDFSLSAEQRELTEAAAALGRELNQDLVKREDAVTADGAGILTREDVLDQCRRWLPGYMVPEIVEFREALPRTLTGEVDWADLAQEQPELETAGDGRRNKR